MLEKPQAGNCFVPFMNSITLLPLISDSMRLRMSSLMDPRFGSVVFVRSGVIADAGGQRERVNRAVHQLAEGGVHHLVLVDPRLASELRRDDDSLEVILRPRGVGHVDACAGESVEQSCTDGLGFRHVSLWN